MNINNYRRAMDQITPGTELKERIMNRTQPQKRHIPARRVINVLLAAGSTNTVTGSHVARIYKEGTTKKLHKYDGAFYSRMRQSTPSNPTLPKNTDGTKRPPVLCGPGAVAE